MISPYAKSKKIIEEYAKIFKGKFNLIGLRYFNVYGPNQKIIGNNLPVIANWIKHLLKNKQLKIYGSGEITRNFVYIDDVVNANIISALTLKKYNFKYMFFKKLFFKYFVSFNEKNS